MISNLGKILRPAKDSDMNKRICRTALYDSETLMLDFIYMMEGRINKTKLIKISDWIDMNVTNCDNSARISAYMYINNRF